MSEIEKLPKNFCPIKNTIIDKLCSTKLTCYEWNILMFIIRKTYGWHNGDGTRKTMDYISLTQFEEVTGIPKSHISRTLKLLVLRHIIKRDDDGKVGVDKCVDNWSNLPNRVNNNLPHQVNRATQRKINLPNRVTTFTQSGKCPIGKNLPNRVTTKEIKETYTKESNNINNIYIYKRKNQKEKRQDLKHKSKESLLNLAKRDPKLKDSLAKIGII